MSASIIRNAFGGQSGFFRIHRWDCGAFKFFTLSSWINGKDRSMREWKWKKKQCKEKEEKERKWKEDVMINPHCVILCVLYWSWPAIACSVRICSPGNFFSRFRHSASLARDKYAARSCKAWPLCSMLSHTTDGRTVRLTKSAAARSADAAVRVRL